MSSAALLALLAIANPEPVRLGILTALFPGTRIEAVPARAIDTGLRHENAGHFAFGDALRTARVYRVSGPHRDDVERCASENMTAGTFSRERAVRLQVFEWPRRIGEYAGVVHYRFDGAHPAMDCSSISRVFRAFVQNGKWTIGEEQILPTQHHNGVQSVRLADVTGDGFEELLLEADIGGAGAVFSVLSIFRLSKGKLEKWFEAPVLASHFEEGEYQQTLDIARTRSGRGARVCFTKTTWREGRRRFEPPRVSRPCHDVKAAYPR